MPSKQKNTLLRKLSNYFIPKDSSQDENFTRKVAALTFFSFTCSIWPIVFALIHKISLEAPPELWIPMICTSLVFGLSPFLLKFTSSFFWSGNWLAFWMAAIIGYSSSFYEGFHSPALPWILAIPIAATFISGIRSGMFWTLAAAAFYMFFYGLYLNNPTYFKNFFTKEDADLMRVLCLVCTAIQIFFFIYFYEEQKNGLFRNLKNKASELLIVNNQLQLQQKKIVMNSKMAALGEMSGEIAHEINNPITIIDLNAGELREICEERCPTREETLKITSTIEKSVARIGKIIKNLRAFNRDGSLDPFEQTSVADLIQGAVELSAERLNKNKVELQLEGQTPGELIECRGVQIQQVILNLLSNGCDALSSEIERKIKISTSFETFFVEIRISNSGPKISHEIGQRIFEPFFTTKAPSKGIGLGLSISKGIIESHNGSISIDENEKITTFVLRLPRKQHSVQKSSLMA